MFFFLFFFLNQMIHRTVIKSKGMYHSLYHNPQEFNNELSKLRLKNMLFAEGLLEAGFRRDHHLCGCLPTVAEVCCGEPVRNGCHAKFVRCQWALPKPGSGFSFSASFMSSTSLAHRWPPSNAYRMNYCTPRHALELQSRSRVCISYWVGLRLCSELVYTE